MATITITSAEILASIVNAPGTGRSPLLCSAANALATSISGGSASSATLFVYGGTVPDFATVTDRAAYASDLLISFVLPATTSSYTTVGYIDGAYRFIAGQCPTATLATGSGTATWFVCCRNNTTSLTDKAAAFGTISGPGGGGDLIMSSTSITAGTSCTSTGFYLNFPTTWTVA